MGRILQHDRGPVEDFRPKMAEIPSSVEFGGARTERTERPDPRFF